MALTCVDLFAGCGGLSLGLEQAGFEPVFVNELHPIAMATYLKNRPGSRVHEPKNQSFDILDLTSSEGQLAALATRLRREVGDVDLVAGGPPCQGFSGIGHRRSFEIWKEDVPSNYLYREMASFVAAIGPRAFVFENVRGLLNARWSPTGTKGEIWEDVKNAFVQISTKRGRRSLAYDVRYSLVYASQHGAPQNRPRVLLVGVREDIHVWGNGTMGNCPLPKPTAAAPDLMDLMDDLVDRNWTPGGSSPKYLRKPRTAAQLALRTTPDGHVLKRGEEVTEQQYSKHSTQVRKKFEYMLSHGGEIPDEMRTKKFAQRVLPRRWGPKGPTITATSLPDDYVHFSQPRTPTVREWARLQTFPDWYQFCGRRTTGGRRRAGDPDAGDWSRDLPKYTQIGNAVPVSLARAIGKQLREALA